MKQEDTNPRYTVTETARLLGVSRQRVLALIREGGLQVLPEDQYLYGLRFYRYVRLAEILRYRREVQGKEDGELARLLAEIRPQPPEAPQQIENGRSQSRGRRARAIA